LATVVARGGTTTSQVTIDSADANTNTLGGKLTVLGLSVQSGNSTTASGLYSHAEGDTSIASGTAAHAEGSGSASGAKAHAEGDSTSATANAAHAEGTYSTASGNSAHAEGNNTTASGYGAHSQGNETTASGDFSFAGGSNATASNDNTFVWSDGTAVGSTTSSQVTFYASNGIRLLGGEVSGNGAGITNLIDSYQGEPTSLGVSAAYSWNPTKYHAYAAPTSTYTFAIDTATTAPRTTYSCYFLSDDTVTFGGNMIRMGDAWTPAATNLVVFWPHHSASTNWWYKGVAQ